LTQLPLLHLQLLVPHEVQLLLLSFCGAQPPLPLPLHTSSVQGLLSAQAGAVVSKPPDPMARQALL